MTNAAEMLERLREAVAPIAINGARIDSLVEQAHGLCVETAQRLRRALRDGDQREAERLIRTLSLAALRYQRRLGLSCYAAERLPSHVDRPKTERCSNYSGCRRG